MLDARDAIELPAGVRLDGDALVDDARGCRFPANDTALFVLANMRRPLGVVAAELALTHRVAPDRAYDDVLRFAYALNASLLANVARASRARTIGGWLVLALRLAPAGALPPTTSHRVALDTSAPLRAAVSAGCALSRRALGLGAVILIALAPGQLTPGALALACGVGLGVIAHEAGHAALLTGISAALVVSGVRTYVLHPPLTAARRALVAMAGPGSATFVGVGAVAIGWLSGVPELALGGCPLAAHAVGLTTVTGDGRAACAL